MTTAQPGQEQMRKRVDDALWAVAKARLTLARLLDYISCHCSDWTDESPLSAEAIKAIASLDEAFPRSTDMGTGLRLPSPPTGQEQRMVTDTMLSAGNVAAKGFLANSELEAIYLAMHAARPTADLGDDGELRAAIIDARLALANWQKYNGEQSDEVVYQAEKMASAIDRIACAVLSRSGG